mmetsp:Transcript_24659/g.37755  ORF Transcript_24659/g.37755 Transcript_24659/m.37755 type:complete len:465 (-) Transcript_24659:676-2070(-)
MTTTNQLGQDGEESTSLTCPDDADKKSAISRDALGLFAGRDDSIPDDDWNEVSALVNGNLPRSEVLLKIGNEDLCQDPAMSQQNPAVSSTPAKASVTSKARPAKRSKLTQYRPGPTHPDLRIPSSSRSLRHDNLRVLHRNTAEDLEDSRITDLLRQEASSTLDLTFTDGGEKVSHQSLKTLNPKLWITDEVINCYLLKVLQPSLRNNSTYFYNSFFFSRLLYTGTRGNDASRYNFEEVRSWSSRLRRQDGILGVTDLFVPINIGQKHWAFLRAQMNTKLITLWDSQGPKVSNRLYLQSMLRYLGDVYKAQTGQDETAWKREWELVDDSENSPRQHNGYDCGIFTITNINLLAQKIPLTAQTYTEANFSEQNTRERMRFSCGRRVKIVPDLARPPNQPITKLASIRVNCSHCSQPNTKHRYYRNSNLERYFPHIFIRFVRLQINKWNTFSFVRWMIETNTSKGRL